jgi:hypothetical protein
LRDRVVEALNGRFQSRVAIDSLQVSLFPRPEVSGAGLELRHNGRTDVPPLITLRSFAGGAGVAGLFATPLSLRSIELDGLTVHIPPRGRRAPPQTPQPADTASDAGGSRESANLPSLVIAHIRATQARVEIESRDPQKPPRVFDIHDLTLENFRPDAAASFTATLTNPVPKGVIATEGEFGPWIAAEPAATALSGRYTFTDANLDTIRGLGGILNSTGTYDGVLERIAVTGQTDTPGFQLDSGRLPVPLRTRFKAVVDGTSGDTRLEHVDGMLGETPIRARGVVVRAKDVEGRLVSLDATVENGRIEDVLRLAVDTETAPMTGRVSVESKIVVPPGKEKVIDRLRLDGRFVLAEARFTSYDVQQRITALSRRARGKDAAAPGESVVSNLNGRFVLRDGVLRFSELAFAVPGAVVRLAGTYSIPTQAMDFKGHLLLDAELADTTTGVKATIAKIFQPMFRGPNGGTKLPIKVTGTRGKPEFGLDVRRALTPGD